MGIPSVSEYRANPYMIEIKNEILDLEIRGDYVFLDLDILHEGINTMSSICSRYCKLYGLNFCNSSVNLTNKELGTEVVINDICRVTSTNRSFVFTYVKSNILKLDSIKEKIQKEFCKDSCAYIGSYCRTDKCPLGEIMNNNKLEL